MGWGSRANSGVLSMRKVASSAKTFASALATASSKPTSKNKRPVGKTVAPKTFSKVGRLGAPFRSLASTSCARWARKRRACAKPAAASTVRRHSNSSLRTAANLLSARRDRAALRTLPRTGFRLLPVLKSNNAPAEAGLGRCPHAENSHATSYFNTQDCLMLLSRGGQWTRNHNWATRVRRAGKRPRHSHDPARGSCAQRTWKCAATAVLPSRVAREESRQQVRLLCEWRRKAWLCQARTPVPLRAERREGRRVGVQASDGPLPSSS